MDPTPDNASPQKPDDFVSFHAKILGIQQTAPLQPSHGELYRVDDVTAAAKQITALTKYIRQSRYWSGLMGCCLINGVIPPLTDIDTPDVFTTFAGDALVPSHKTLHQIRRDMRDWREAERNTGLVDFIVFFTWCEEEGIDTNYLRLLREIADCSTHRTIGVLPLTDVERFERD